MSIMHSVLLSLFTYKFAARAIFAGTAVSLCAALIGVVLTLRRSSMLGDGLSHTAFAAVVIAAATGWSPYWASLIITLAAAFLILRIKPGHGGDTAVAVISVSSLAVGMLVISQNSGLNVNMNEYLFGSILSMSRTDVFVAIGLSVFVLAVFLLCRRVIFSMTFDEGFCKACGVKTEFYKNLIAVLTAVIVVMGMRIVGALLMTNLLIYPAVSSMKLLRSFKGVLICSACVSVFCFLLGIVTSCVLGTPAGAGIVVMNIIVYAVVSVFNAISGRIHMHT